MTGLARRAGERDAPVLRARGSGTCVPASGRIEGRAAEDTGEITVRVISEVVEGYPGPGLPTLHEQPATAGLLSVREASLR